MNYSGLITDIADLINRADLNTQIGTAINTVKHNLEKKHNFNYMKQKDSSAVVLASGSYRIDFPTNYKEMIWFKWVDSAGTYLDIVQRSEAQALRLYPDLTNDTGEPILYAPLWDESKFMIRPTADAAYNLYRAYYRKLPDYAASTNESDWLMANAWEVLKYGAMEEIIPIIEKDPQKMIYQVKYWKGKKEEVFNDQLKSEIAEANALERDGVDAAYPVK